MVVTRFLVRDRVGLGGGFSDRQKNLESINQFRLNEIEEAYADSLLQEQLNHQEQLDYQFRFSYTEPISRGTYLQVAYQHYQDRQESQQEVYDLEANQRKVNEALSNQYQRDYFYDRIGLTLRRNRKQQNFALGLQ